MMLLFVLFISGCAGLGSIIAKGADANDALVNGSIKGMCDVYSVGSIKRKFPTKELRELYNKMCSTLNDTANEL